MILILLLYLSSCSSVRKIPYKENKTYYFSVKIEQQGKVIARDTLSFFMDDINSKDLEFGGRTLVWKSTSLPDFKAGRGININKASLEIQMPISYSLFENENIAIAPYPSNSKNDKEGYSSNSIHKFERGYGNLTGKTIHQEEKVMKSEKIIVNNREYNCRVIIGENTSLINELGLYKIKTFYNHKYGFIKIVYEYPNDKIITLELIIDA